MDSNHSTLDVEEDEIKNSKLKIYFIHSLYKITLIT